MAFEIRKIGIILAVAVLYSIFVFSLGSAITPDREYPSMCQEAQDENRPRVVPHVVYREDVNCTELPEPTQEEIAACPGQLSPDYGTGRCPESYVCNCYVLSEDFRQQEATIQFWIGVVFGALAIVGGMLLPRGREIHDWIGTGFILGGLVTLFIATAQYWGEINEWARPFVILVELLLVLWLAYRRFGPDLPKQGKGKR